MARKVEYLPDGKRVTASAGDVASSWSASTSRIPVNFALGTAQHESGYAINEVDTEPTGYVSKGIFQLSDDEARSVGRAGADLLALDDSVDVFARLCEKRLDAIVKAAQLDESIALPDDVWPYLFIAHNQGLAAALKSIGNFGLNWSAYKERNPTHPEWAAYGDDVISGGKSGGVVGKLIRLLPNAAQPGGDSPVITALTFAVILAVAGGVLWLTLSTDIIKGVRL
jgi:hypothetical protein